MIEELEKLINNYEKLKRDLTGNNLNSLELISELEGLFDNVVANRDKWNLSDEVASNNIFNVLIATKMIVNTLVSLKNTYTNNHEIECKKSKDNEEPKEVEEFKIKQAKEVLKDLEDINSKLIKIKTSLYDYTKISDVIYFLNGLMKRNEPNLINSIPTSISVMIYDGLRAVKQNAQFMQDIYLDYYRKHRDDDSWFNRIDFDFILFGLLYGIVIHTLRNSMTVREYIESNKEKLLGYKLRIEDYDGYELFAIRVKKETNLDNIKDPLEQQLIDDELVGIHGDADDYEPQMILTSRCELWEK